MLFDSGASRETNHVPFSLGDIQRLAEYWIILIELSCHLGRILAMNYRLVRTKPSLHEVETLEKQLLQSRLPDQYEGCLTPSSRFHANHVHLHYQWVLTHSIVRICVLMKADRAMLITFYRPWGMELPSDISSPADKEWQHRMRLRADAAASRTNEILDALVQDNLLGFAGPMT
jgi:hypothetical protein